MQGMQHSTTRRGSEGSPHEQPHGHRRQSISIHWSAEFLGTWIILFTSLWNSKTSADLQCSGSKQLRSCNIYSSPQIRISNGYERETRVPLPSHVAHIRGGFDDNEWNKKQDASRLLYGHESNIPNSEGAMHSESNFDHEPHKSVLRQNFAPSLADIHDHETVSPVTFTRVVYSKSLRVPKLSRTVEIN
mmetsp:Transcript_31961/g.85351  ORF Transcript_31961/g.85351 Transcript_31961/m.85351 type:complete len:189 (+) Transcript_31961:134-700(+)